VDASASAGRNQQRAKPNRAVLISCARTNYLKACVLT
jgi:hypothetical protein